MSIKLGIIGTGIFFQKKHLPLLVKDKTRFSVEAIYTSKPEKFVELKRSFSNAVWYKDVDQLLEHDVDAVVACIPIPQHFAIGSKVLGCGKHLLIEKPMSHDLKSAEALIDLARHKKKCLMVAESYRYIKVFQHVKDILRKNQLGALKKVQLNLSVLLDERSPYYQTSWRIDPQGYPGILWDGGIHTVSMLRDMLGDLNVISKHFRSINSALGAYDTVHVELRTKDNIPVVYDLSYSTAPQGEFFLNMEFSDGNIKANLTRAVIEHNGKVETISDISDAYEAIYQDFYDYVFSGREPLYSAQEAYLDLKILSEMVL